MNGDEMRSLASLRARYPGWNIMVTPNGVIIAESRPPQRPEHIMWDRTVSGLTAKIEAAEHGR